MKNNCNTASNNKHLDCPAIMSDGRTFTDYRPSSTVDDMIRLSNNVMSNFEYRQFLTNNGDSIMQINNKYLENKLGCGGCNTPNVPFDKTCVYNSSYGVCGPSNMNGIGINNTVVSNNPTLQKPYSIGSNTIEHFNNNPKNSITSIELFDGVNGNSNIKLNPPFNNTTYTYKANIKDRHIYLMVQYPDDINVDYIINNQINIKYMNDLPSGRKFDFYLSKSDPTLWIRQWDSSKKKIDKTYTINFTISP